MKIAEYVLYCVNCADENQGPALAEMEWKTIPAEKVQVNLDLRSECYRFYAKCPDCGKMIQDTRRAF